MKKFFQIAGKVLGVLAKVLAFFTLCGIYDVRRNGGLNQDVLKRYFTGNGMLTWLMSPINLVMDLLTLPYRNKGIYKLEDLPESHQAEIRQLIDAAHRENLVEKLEERVKDNARSMVFFKWYGTNQDAIVDIPAFHQEYQYIQTIGVSVFNKKASTSRHFGPFRATLRVLYNINDMRDRSAYIQVGDVTHYWMDEKLFIFDDTLLHQSFNETDQVRYCLFVDILRPARSPKPLQAVVNFSYHWLKGVNAIFYKAWDVIKK